MNLGINHNTVYDTLRTLFIVVFLLAASGVNAQRVVEGEKLVLYLSADSTYEINVLVPGVTGMKDVKKQDKLNAMIRERVMPDSIDSLIRNYEAYIAAAKMDTADTWEPFMEGGYSFSGEVLLLPGDLLLLHVFDSDYGFEPGPPWVAATLITINVKTLQEITWRDLLSKAAADRFARFFTDTEGNETSSGDALGRIRSLGITNQCDECEDRYCLTFYADGISTGMGYQENQICLPEDLNVVNKKYRKHFDPSGANHRLR